MKGPTTNQASDKNSNLDSQSITDRTLRGFFWTSTGTGIQVLLQVAVLAVLARLLTPSDFGLVAAASVVVSFSEIFSWFGMAPVVVQRPTLEARHVRTGFTLSLLFGVLLAGLIWLLAPAIASSLRMNELTPVLRVMVLVFPFHGASTISGCLLLRELRFRCLVKISVVSYALGYGVVGVSLAFMNFGVWALVGGSLARSVLGCIILLLVQPHQKKPQIDRDALKELMYFGGGFTIYRIFNYFALEGDNLVVGRWLGTGALGLYGRAYQLMAMPAGLYGQVVDSVLFPVIAKMQNETERLATAYRRGVALTALLVLPA
ncbi:MAG TPA: lipopolysaccharide biosynthesis protein, partial [Nitrososphaerales archaeon]